MIDESLSDIICLFIGVKALKCAVYAQLGEKDLGKS